MITLQVKSSYEIRGKGWSSSIQERVSHTYIFRLDNSKIFILYKKMVYDYIMSVPTVSRFLQR